MHIQSTWVRSLSWPLHLHQNHLAIILSPMNVAISFVRLTCSKLSGNLNYAPANERIKLMRNTPTCNSVHLLIISCCHCVPTLTTIYVGSSLSPTSTPMQCIASCLIKSHHLLLHNSNEKARQCEPKSSSFIFMYGIWKVPHNLIAPARENSLSLQTF